MNAPDKLPPETRQPVSGYLWGALAVLTCITSRWSICAITGSLARKR